MGANYKQRRIQYQNENLNQDQPNLQVTFSEKGTKMTSQLHISEFEILSFQ